MESPGTSIIIGKMYKVTCAIIYTDKGKEIAVPVIGIKHADPKFGTPHNHYHIDGRFTDYLCDDKGRTNHAIWDKGTSWFDKPIHELLRLEIRIRKCRRTTTGIKPPASASSYHEWYASMVGKSCKGKKCPHYGTEMHEHDGVLVCPLHNLKGDLQTEVIIEDIIS